MKERQVEGGRERRREEGRNGGREGGKDRKKKKGMRVSQGGQWFLKFLITEKRIQFDQHALFSGIFDIPSSNLPNTFQ